MRSACLALLCIATTLAQSSEVDRLRIQPASYLAHVKALSSDDFAGRGNGSLGLERASQYIESEFKKAGLMPGGDSDKFLQSFDISKQLELDDTNAVTVTGGGAEAFVFRIGAHYYPLSKRIGNDAKHSSNRTTDTVVFAGYGIAAPELGYDDYAAVDVHDKAVLVWTHEPQEHDRRSSFDGQNLTPHSDIARKVEMAARRGASLLLVVEDPSHTVDRARMRSWASDPQADEYPIPVVRVDRLRLQRALGGIDLEATARVIDRMLQPQSRVLPGVTITYSTTSMSLAPIARNVVGILRGSDQSRANEAVVVGAHYDHLGLGGPDSLEKPATSLIHNGADDNASGTALVIEMAHAAARHARAFGRTVVFVAFAGEELGLLGSQHYVAHVPVGLTKTVAMINLDMVGRAQGRVLIGGVERHARLKTIVDELRPLTMLRLDDFQQGYGAGASDNDPFERERVPTLQFFTGFHADYHRASDDWPRIDAAGAAEIGRIALAAVARLATGEAVGTIPGEAPVSPEGDAISIARAGRNTTKRPDAAPDHRRNPIDGGAATIVRGADGISTSDRSGATRCSLPPSKTLERRGG